MNVAAIYDRRRRSQTAATEARVKTEISTDFVAAVELLQRGEVVALPTETVYGLAANALDSAAVIKIFEAKERPKFDPLIVHLPNRDWLEKIVVLDKGDRDLVQRLAKNFWPGPFTMVFRKQPIIPDLVTAGLNTAAVRMSAHPMFSVIIRNFGKPLAAPSANRFGRISPTTAEHVRDELDGCIPLIIDGGPATHGIESTIVTIRDGGIDVLRRGPVTNEQLSEFGQVRTVERTDKIMVPGQLPSHYAPKTPLRLIEDAKSFSLPKDQKIGLLAWNPHPGERFAAVANLSEKQDLREAAANLFGYLRQLDALGLDLIVAEKLPEDGLGAAIMDRLRRAAIK